MPKQWYIIHTYSGFEERVKKTLEQRIDALGMQEFFGEVRIPTETVVEMRSGKRREVQRKFFPGYVLVQIELAGEKGDEAWHLVRNTPKVTGFVGSGKKPTPLTEDEVNQILHQVTVAEGEAEAQARFREGRTGPDHRRAVLQLHGRRGGGQPGPLHAEGHGHDLRTIDTRRARVLPGAEDR